MFERQEQEDELWNELYAKQKKVKEMEGKFEVEKKLSGEEEKKENEENEILRKNIERENEGIFFFGMNFSHIYQRNRKYP